MDQQERRLKKVLESHIQKHEEEIAELTSVIKDIGCRLIPLEEGENRCPLYRPPLSLQPISRWGGLLDALGERYSEL
jgi:hypothetical protein